MPPVSGNHPHTTVPLSPEGRTARTLHPIATIKKQPDPFPLNQAVFFFPIHGNGRTNAIQSPPHLFPSIPRQAQQTKGLLPCSLPTSRKSWRRMGWGLGRGRRNFLQKAPPSPPQYPPRRPAYPPSPPILAGSRYSLAECEKTGRPEGAYRGVMGRDPKAGLFPHPPRIRLEAKP